jgi:hypothetical protein
MKQRKNRMARKSIWLLSLPEQAHEAHGLDYEKGLSAMDRFSPDRFTWFCDEAGDAKECVKLKDNQTGRVVVWPHWRG